MDAIIFSINLLVKYAPGGLRKHDSKFVHMWYLQKKNHKVAKNI